MEKKQYFVIMLLSSFWIIFNQLPIVPLGGIICLIYMIIVKRYKVIPVVIVCCILGFIGTGVSFSINNATTHTKEGKKLSGIEFNANINVGASTIDYLINKDKLTVYNDNLYERDINEINELLIKQFVQNYNNKNIDFFINSFTKYVWENEIDKMKELIKDNINRMHSEMGKIEDYSYIGYQFYKIKGGEEIEIRVFYKLKSELNSEFNSLEVKYCKTNNTCNLIGYTFLKNKEYNVIGDTPKKQ